MQCRFIHPRSVMNVKNLLIAITFTAGMTSQLSAFEPIVKLSGHWKCWPDCVGKYCCDDYRPKPKPCAVGVKCFDCPDYCPKPFPCSTPGKASFCCDDFCRKPLPPHCRTSSKNFRCVPSRLSPTYMTVPKKEKPPTAALLSAEERGNETRLISSLRRVQSTLGSFSSDALGAR